MVYRPGPDTGIISAPAPSSADHTSGESPFAPPRLRHALPATRRHQREKLGKAENFSWAPGRNGCKAETRWCSSDGKPIQIST